MEVKKSKIRQIGRIRTMYWLNRMANSIGGSGLACEFPKCVIKSGVIENESLDGPRN